MKLTSCFTDVNWPALTYKWRDEDASLTVGFFSEGRSSSSSVIDYKPAGSLGILAAELLARPARLQWSVPAADMLAAAG